MGQANGESNKKIINHPRVEVSELLTEMGFLFCDIAILVIFELLLVDKDNFARLEYLTLILQVFAPIIIISIVCLFGTRYPKAPEIPQQRVEDPCQEHQVPPIEKLGYCSFLKVFDSRMVIMLIFVFIHGGSLGVIEHFGGLKISNYGREVLSSNLAAVANHAPEILLSFFSTKILMNLPYRGLTLICGFCLFTELMVMGLSANFTPYAEMVAAALHSVDYYLYLAGLITHSRKLLKQSMQRKMGPKYEDLVYDKFAVYLTTLLFISHWSLGKGIFQITLYLIFGESENRQEILFLPIAAFYITLTMILFTIDYYQDKKLNRRDDK